MLHDNLLLLLGLLMVIFLLVMLGQRLRVSYPIFLVVGGMLLGLVPGVPHLQLDPDVVFLLFLPPLLYEAAWYTSWKNFWRWRRAIVMLAFGLVIFTSTLIAFLSTALIPGFTMALGFLLGGIISPPDAVAATSVLKGLPVPKRVTSILEGESLLNDASSLTVFRFALAAVLTGHFILQEALVTFLLVTVMGIVVGIAIANVFYFLHKHLPTTPEIDAAMTFVAPYVMYLTAEHFHYSGVLAVVSGGLFLSFRSNDFLSYRSKMQGIGIWSTITFVLNGVVFLMIGLQLPIIVAGMSGESLKMGLFYALIISLVTILIRIIWVFPSTYLPRILSRRVRQSEPFPGWQGPFLVSWAGMRGVVSLASALAIPLTLPGGEPFPFRNLILFITFVVILVTLVFQGLSLSPIVKAMQLEDPETATEAEEEARLRLRLNDVALQRLTHDFAAELPDNDLLRGLQEELETNHQVMLRRMESLECDTDARQEVARYNAVLLELIESQRKELSALRRQNLYDDEMLRRQESQLDLDALQAYVRLN